MKKYTIFKEGSRANQIVCAVLINMPVFVYGTCVGWMSPMSLLLQSDNSPRGEPLSDVEVSWMAAATSLACIPALYLVGYLGDKIGRKKTLLMMSLTYVIIWCIKLVSLSTWALILSQTLLAFSMAGCYVICPIYTKEISDTNMRGVLGSLVTLFQTTGNLFVYIIGDLLNYQTVSWICVALPIIHLILFMLMPESPSYLIKKGRNEEAGGVIAWLRCKQENDICVHNEIVDIIDEQKNDEKNSKFIYKALINDKILFRAYLIALVVLLSREVCGALPVLNFAGTIFAMSSEGTHLNLSPNQQAMVLGSIQVAGSLLAFNVVEKFGRKPLLFVTSLVAGLSMCGLASWFLAGTLNMHGPDWIPVATLCICIFCDSSGIQPLSVVISGELFSYKYRSSALASILVIAAAADFLQLLFFKPVVASVGIHVAFYFFGVVCLAGALFALIVMPETRRKSVDEIYEKLGKKK